jgi:hypothetical protein
VWLQRWDIVTMLSLLFTAVVTPVEVAFLATALNGLFVLNRLVDMIFIVVRALPSTPTSRLRKPPLACGG